jgi:hypothetical protein
VKKTHKKTKAKESGENVSKGKLKLKNYSETATCLNSAVPQSPSGNLQATTGGNRLTRFNKT